MALVRIAVTVVLGLLAVQASAGDLAERAAASSAIDTSGSTTALAVGEGGVLVIAIRPVPDVHVQSQAPLRVTLSASSGLALSRDRLGWPDARPPGSGSPRFDVAFSATASGPQTATARLEFFVCSGKWCAKQEREVTLHVAVRGRPAQAEPTPSAANGRRSESR